MEGFDAKEQWTEEKGTFSGTESRQNVLITHVCNLVFGADDSVLREFTELDVVVVYKGVPGRESKHFSNIKHHSPYTMRNSGL